VRIHQPWQDGDVAEVHVRGSAASRFDGRDAFTLDHHDAALERRAVYREDPAGREGPRGLRIADGG
jgi:hypothetical protein